MTKIPGKPCVSNMPLLLLLRNESWMTREPLMSLLTKKMAPPPSFAVLSVIFTAEGGGVYGVALLEVAPAAPAARRAGLGRVRAAADCLVEREEAVQDGVRNADAAERAAVRADVRERVFAA